MCSPVIFHTNNLFLHTFTTLPSRAHRNDLKNVPAVLYLANRSTPADCGQPDPAGGHRPDLSHLAPELCGLPAGHRVHGRPMRSVLFLSGIRFLGKCVNDKLNDRCFWCSLTWKRLQTSFRRLAGNHNHQYGQGIFVTWTTSALKPRNYIVLLLNYVRHTQSRRDITTASTF